MKEPEFFACKDFYKVFRIYFQKFLSPATS